MSKPRKTPTPGTSRGRSSSSARAGKPRPPGSQPGRLRRLLQRLPWRRIGLLALLLAGLGLGVLLPYLWAVDARVREEFGALHWQVPTRVLARPLLLQPGMAMNHEALERELAAARYRDDGQAQLPGRYARDGDRFVVATRAFVDIDGAVPEQRFAVTLSKGRVATLESAEGGHELDSVRIDPARIATLHGTRQEERLLVKAEQVPALLVTTLQAVEDRSFKHHHGVDPWAIVRAAWANLSSGEVRQGGSTLTQQLVRNLFLDRGQRFTRKLNEAVHALMVEARFDKRAILEAYLNQVYLGQDGGQAVHGVAAAADFWFGRALDDLAAQEIALLVGMIQGPSLYDPRRHPQRALARRNLVLEQMAETGLIDAARMQRLQQLPLGVSRTAALARNRYPAFLDMVRRQLAAQYPEDQLRGAGLTVLTTLAPSVQQLSEDAVGAALATLDEDRPPLQAALVVTSAQHGEVLAIVGGRDADRHGFNRALDAQRPIGSLVKPFVYLLALAQPDRWALASPIDDAALTVPLAAGKSWTPANSSNRSHGQVVLADALAHSYNQATVRLGLEVGVERLSQLLEALAGMQLPAHPSLLLGSADLSPLQATQMYQFLAAGGQQAPLRAVRGVLDAGGSALARYDSARPAADAGDALAARLVTLALQRAARSGTAARLQSEGVGWLQPAGKTGTSNDARDSWFAGYTGSHLAVAWVGNDGNEPTGLMGATGAMKVWSTLFRTLPTEPLRVGEQGMEWAWVDTRPGMLEQFETTESDCEGAERMAFVQGYLPRHHGGCGWERVRGWFGADSRAQADGRSSDGDWEGRAGARGDSRRLTPRERRNARRGRD